MKRKTVERTRNSGTMTEAEFKSFVISALRNASRFWKPKQACIKKARVSYNSYRCSQCNAIWPSKLPPLPWKKRKRHNITADHIVEIVPKEGFTTYDSWIERCFVEEEGWQALCWECDQKKTQEHQQERREERKKN